MSANPILRTALWLTDRFYAVIPRRVPSSDALRRCKIISHRGEHDNVTVFENTIKAFEIAHNAGAWGLETDIRWTRDLVPMVAHDPDTKRVFGKDLLLADTNFQELRHAIPDIPTLEEFVLRFGGKSHLMIEIKDEVFPDLEKQKSILGRILSGLAPRSDYHLLALDPALFDTFDIVSTDAFLPVATLNYKVLSDQALIRGYAGISGHFLVLSDVMKNRHFNAEQMFGTGFPTSKNALYRELNRGVEHVFTNDAVKLLRVIEKALER